MAIQQLNTMLGHSGGCLCQTSQAAHGLRRMIRGSVPAPWARSSSKSCSSSRPALPAPGLVLLVLSVKPVHKSSLLGVSPCFLLLCPSGCWPLLPAPTSSSVPTAPAKSLLVHLNHQHPSAARAGLLPEQGWLDLPGAFFSLLQ